MIFKIKIILFIFLLILNYLIDFNNGTIIKEDGDYLFGLLSDIVYMPKSTNTNSEQYKYISLNGECMEWKIILDHSRIMIFQSKFSNNLIVSFRGTQGFSDIITDIKIVPTTCNITSGCGKLHYGFQQEYYETYDILLSIIKSLDQPYDIYFTGHSLGGALALIAAYDYTVNQRQKQKYIKSIHCVTFGQPAVGDEQFSNSLMFYSQRFQYRRYVNYNSKTAILGLSPQEDPIPNSIFSHPTNAIMLDCLKTRCPMVPLGLHFMDLYLGNVFNQHYSECSSNCKFEESNANIYKYQSYKCPINKESLIKGSFNPQGIMPDKYSVCLFTSAQDFDQYEYKQSTDCNLKSGTNSNATSIIIKKTSNRTMFEKKVLQGKELYVVVENRNNLFATSSFSYNITFTNSITAPSPPTNLSCTVSSLKNDTIGIMVSFNYHQLPQHIYSLYNLIIYRVYLSEIGKEWSKFEFIESATTKFVSKFLNIPMNGIYSIVVTADNGAESHASNFAYIFGNSTLI
ncbi:hypothetical protein DDB_G0274675 [Dictyostelium discoideum AX4]|uniref:Fungal lipase-type domain-containing protein n=1 Tax=Dictyostelium discoideum TaxID=44689 RepID=Q555H0_DICDI|nr:hypothetical protein DDB_G0274675 [Dictyostelium discoideum AX4]EAL70230.1 hypothetical protein DDB_G0274675 [Dictyostelium discoideum AX4]|eukprot:XP_644099.1 hypothetical protein DDB_G0274675 [Dictyostelium discoideum AX4]